MTFEHAFECLEIQYEGQYYQVYGCLEVEAEDNSFSYDYGEQTNLTHDPGTSFDIENVVLESVMDENDKDIYSDLSDRHILDFEDEVKNWFDANGYDSLMTTLNDHIESAKEEAAIARYESQKDDRDY